MIETLSEVAYTALVWISWGLLAVVVSIAAMVLYFVASALIDKDFPL